VLWAGITPGWLVAKQAEALGFLVFASGKEAEQVAVGQGAEFLGAVAIAVQAVVGEDARLVQAVLLLQLIESGQDDAKAAVHVTQGLKHLGFQLRVFLLWVFYLRVLGLRVTGLRVRVAAHVLGLGLRQRIGAFNFMNSHRYLHVR
jgi:hypothetical protein